MFHCFSHRHNTYLILINQLRFRPISSFVNANNVTEIQHVEVRYRSNGRGFWNPNSLSEPYNFVFEFAYKRSNWALPFSSILDEDVATAFVDSMLALQTTRRIRRSGLGSSTTGLHEVVFSSKHSPYGATRFMPNDSVFYKVNVTELMQFISR